MINQITIQFLLKQEINRLTAELIKDQMELRWLERQRAYETHEHFMRAYGRKGQ